MTMFGIILVGASGRLSVELQAGEIQLLQTNFTGVKTHHSVFAYSTEEFAAVFFTRPEFLLVSKRFKQSDLLVRIEAHECLARIVLAVRVQPTQTGAQALLQIRIARSH